MVEIHEYSPRQIPIVIDRYSLYADALVPKGLQVTGLFQNK